MCTHCRIIQSEAEVPADISKYAKYATEVEMQLLIGYVDKPNLHKFVEFAVCTVPLYERVHALCELSLEKNHQYLKKTLN